MTDMEDTRVIRTDEYLSTSIDGEEVILHLDSGTYFGVNGVGTRIWELAASEPTVSDIEDSIHNEFDVDREQVKTDIREFLTDLESAELIEFVDDA